MECPWDEQGPELAVGTMKTESYQGSRWLIEHVHRAENWLMRTPAADHPNRNWWAGKNQAEDLNKEVTPTTDGSPSGNCKSWQNIPGLILRFLSRCSFHWGWLGSPVLVPCIHTRTPSSVPYNHQTNPVSQSKGLITELCDSNEQYHRSTLWFCWFPCSRSIWWVT